MLTLLGKILLGNIGVVKFEAFSKYFCFTLWLYTLLVNMETLLQQKESVIFILSANHWNVSKAHVKGSNVNNNNNKTLNHKEEEVEGWFKGSQFGPSILRSIKAAPPKKKGGRGRKVFFGYETKSQSCI